VRLATVLTGDPEFRKVENLISIDWLPQRMAEPPLD
jgi:hypothetical protein